MPPGAELTYGSHPPPSAHTRSLSAAVDSAERESIESALKECGGNRERAAELLEVSPTTLWRKMTRLGIVFE
jgi:two-component system response regulator HydG